jgi:hypothetical protein
MDHLNPNYAEGINSKILRDPSIPKQDATIGEEKVASVARANIHSKEEKGSEVEPPSLQGRVSKGIINELVAIADRVIQCKGSFDEKEHRELLESVSKHIHRPKFQETLLTTIERHSDVQEKILTLSNLANLPFIEEGKFKEKLETSVITLIKSLPTEITALSEEESMLMGGGSMISAPARRSLIKEDENNTSLPLKDRFESVFLRFRPHYSDEVVVSIGDKTFNCILHPDGYVIIKDKSPTVFGEGYKAIFKNRSDAALFLSTQKKPNPKYRDEIVWTYVSPSKYQLGKFHLTIDLKSIQSVNVQDPDLLEDIEDWEDILERINDDFSYCPEYKDQIITSLNLKVKEIYESNNVPRLCHEFLDKEGPVQAIKVLQLLEKIPHNHFVVSNNFFARMDRVWMSLQVMCCKRLFLEHEVASNGISQRNFEDQSLGIIKGGANYCCGSMSVQMLIARIRNTGLTLNENLREGVIRHLKLPPLQMRNGTTIKSLLEANSNEIASAGQPYYENRRIPYVSEVDRFVNFFLDIPNGTSGILQVHEAALMLSIHDDGKIELFDSHGSSAPLIHGQMNPAYKALFNTKKELSAYLSVHRRPEIENTIAFHPIKVL